MAKDLITKFLNHEYANHDEVSNSAKAGWIWAPAAVLIESAAEIEARANEKISALAQLDFLDVEVERKLDNNVEIAREIPNVAVLKGDSNSAEIA